MSFEELWLAAIPFTIASIALTVGFSRSWKLGMSTILVMYVANAVIVGLPGADTGLIIIYPQDWLFICIAISAIFGKTYRYRGCVLLLTSLVLLQFVLGAWEFSLKEAGVDIRQIFYFLATLDYSASRGIDSLTIVPLNRLVKWTAVTLLLTAIVRWVLVGLASPTASFWESVSGVFPLRVMTAAEALLILQAIPLALSEEGFSNRLRPLTALTIGASLGAIILLQHRTVWAVAIATIVAVPLLYPTTVRTLIKRALLPLLAGAFIGLIVVALQLDQVSNSLRDSLASVFSEDSTFGWRVEMWQRVLGQETERRPFEYFVGEPFGSRYSGARNQKDVTEEDRSPHNFYVQVFARTGLLGLAALLVVLFAAIGASRNLGTPNLGPRQALGVVVVGQLVYAFSYSPDFTQAILLGAALALRPAWQINRSQVGGQLRRSYVASAHVFAQPLDHHLPNQTR